MKCRFKLQFGLQFVLVVAVAVSLVFFVISMFVAKTVTPSLKSNEYSIVRIGEWRGLPRNPTDKLYLLEIGSPHQYFVRLHYYDWEMKGPVAQELSTGVGTCVLRFMIGNLVVFAHDLRDESNSCYLPIKFTNNCEFILFRDLDRGRNSDNPVLAIACFPHNNGTYPNDRHPKFYESEEAIIRKCDAEHIGCVWITLETVVSTNNGN